MGGFGGFWGFGGCFEGLGGCFGGCFEGLGGCFGGFSVGVFGVVLGVWVFWKGFGEVLSIFNEDFRSYIV